MKTKLYNGFVWGHLEPNWCQSSSKVFTFLERKEIYLKTNALQHASPWCMRICTWNCFYIIILLLLFICTWDCSYIYESGMVESSPYCTMYIYEILECDIIYRIQSFRVYHQIKDVLYF